jgi:hypothetical protein
VRQRTVAACVAVVVVLVPACGDDDEPEEPAAGTTEPVAAPGESDGAAEPTYTFAGGEGDEVCRYEGPDELPRELSSTMTNESDEQANVTWARLADGASYQDFIDYLGTLGEGYPVLAPRAANDPANHEWMQGEWLQIHQDVAGGASDETQWSGLFAGDYVSFCYTDDPDGQSQVWPAGPVTVRG